MASPIERREREKKELRTKILDAARELFITHGYDAVTMRKVAEKIEYSPTAIYLYFKDKDALIRDLCTYDFEAFAARFFDVAAVSDPVERLRKTGQVYTAFALEHPQQYRLMFMTPHPNLEPTDAEINDPARNAYVFLRATVEQVIREGRCRPEIKDAELVSQTIWAATHGVVSLEIAKGCEHGWVNWRPIKDRIETMMETLFALLLKDDNPAPTQRSNKRSKRSKGRR